MKKYNISKHDNHYVGRMNLKGVHVYLSTACLHEQHNDCHKKCKYCSVDCICKCHGIKNV